MVAIIDRFLGKWASRKLMVFALATVLLIFDKISGSDWVYVAIAYTFVQGLVDAKIFLDKNK